MNRFIMEEYYNDPAVGRRMYEAARRDRALAMAAGLEWLFGALRSLATNVVAHFKPRGSAGWIERLG